MFGIRHRNYNYDLRIHPPTWPKYKEFLSMDSWDEITDPLTKNTLLQRSEFDPIYHRSLTKSIKKPWSGMDSVQENFSQSWQDWFVLTALDGKTNGHWLELGASDPIYMNNTFLLESKFQWTGISIDKRDNLVDEWSSTRSTPLSIIDALDADWKGVLKNSPAQIDYLQADLADWATLEVLENLPHDSYRFSVITFEHDIFQADPKIQQRQRVLLHDLGYHLLITNVAVKNYATNTWEPFEDWWIDPNVISPARLSVLQDTSDRMKLPHEIFTLL